MTDEWYYSVSITTEKDSAPDVEEFFLRSGAEGFYELLYDEAGPSNLETDHTVLVFFFAPEFPVSAFVPMALAALGRPEDPFEIARTNYEDYVKAFEESFRAFPLTTEVWLAPPWDPEIPAGCMRLLLKPGLAFGTGKHETSQLMVEIISRIVRAEDSVYDLGTGTGILAIAAGLYGAAEVHGVDVERLAVESAAENALLNQREGLSAAMRFDLGDFTTVPDLQKKDVFLANILANIFEANADALRKHLSEFRDWALSGITENQAESFEGFLKKITSRRFAKLAAGGWVAYYSE